jgi:hypothetical protein
VLVQTGGVCEGIHIRSRFCTGAFGGHPCYVARPDTAILYAFDLIEHDGEDMPNRPFLDRKNALARLLSDTEAGILFNEHIAQDGPVVFAQACWLGPGHRVRNAASITVQRERSETWTREPRNIRLWILRLFVGYQTIMNGRVR